MSSSGNNIKMKMIEWVCKNYVSKDSKGKIVFKSDLKRAIGNGDIYEEDAQLIVLELMYNIKKYNFSHESILEILDKLISKVKEHNIKNEKTLKTIILFSNDYDCEREVLSEYLDSLIPSPPDEPANDKVLQKTKSKDIKQYLKDFSPEELCFILDINPDLNFYGEKQLKKLIVDEFSKYSFDENKLEGASSQDIKKYLDNLAEEDPVNEINELSLQIQKDDKRNVKENKLYENKSKINDSENVKISPDFLLDRSDYLIIKS